MREDLQRLPSALLSLIEQLPPEVRGPIEAKFSEVEAHLENLRPVLDAIDTGLAVAAPFLALEAAETQAAEAAAAAATAASARAHEEVRALSTALDDAREAETARWAEAITMLTEMGDDTAVDLDRLARVLEVDEVAATDEAFDAFMLDDGVPLVLGPPKPRPSNVPTGRRLDRIARRHDGDCPVNLEGSLSRLTVPGTLAPSPAGLLRVDGELVAMLLGDGTRVRVVGGALVREPDDADVGNPAPSRLVAQRLAGAAPPLLLPGAAAGIANAFTCREHRLEAAPDRVPALLGLGAAIELGDRSDAGLKTVAPHLRALWNARTDPTKFVAVAHDLYRVRTWLEPSAEHPPSLPVIHVGHVRWCTLTARPLTWMPVLAGAQPTVAGVDRPWTTDSPSGGATWQAVSPAVQLDPDWAAPLVVVPGDSNVWCIDPDGEWWSLDVDYDAIVEARRAHCEGWLRALEALHAGASNVAGELPQLEDPNLFAGDH